MRQETLRFQSHRISRTLYGASKRFGEALAFKLGRAAGREVFALRLGQVHGELQNESARVLSEMREGPAIVPDTASDSVFAFTVAEALIHIANGKEQPGTYTLVSEPQWRWKEVYEYYARQAGIEPEARPVSPDRYSPPKPRGIRALRGTVMSSAMAKATLFRESISAYALWRRPALERRLASSYRRKNAARDIAALESPLEYRPCDARLGDVLGARLKSLSDSRTSMAKTISQLRAMLDQAAAPRRQADILKVKNS
jgi:nucleoside-diphosphate-sugar epimerase